MHMHRGFFQKENVSSSPHGILVDQGFQMEEVYNGKTFPEYIDRPDETVAVLSLENEAGIRNTFIFQRTSVPWIR